VTLEDHQLGFEARASDDDHMAVKIWLRLLSCSTQIEHLIRDHLRREFGTTLARFDYLAQLQRHPEGLRMNALSRYLMVTGGNVTGLTDQLEAEGWVRRLPDPNDRRSYIVQLTHSGLDYFQRMAQAHEEWLRKLFEGFDSGKKAKLFEDLGVLRMHLSKREPPAQPEALSQTPSSVPPLRVMPAAPRKKVKA
jgi:DNA-binding MarR family transcriptional regulator